MKPCPFCGELAHLPPVVRELKTTAAPWWYVECSFCYARTGSWRPEERAVEEWNKRAS